MTKQNKLLIKLYSKPIPNDMRRSEIEKIVKSFGCIFTTGGNHQYRIIYPPLGRVIPLPCHGDTVSEMYIKEIKDLIDEIQSSNKGENL